MRAVAYVDGSFSQKHGKYAFGCVCFHADGEKEEFCGSGSDPEALKQRNVAGEMIASMLAVRWALINEYDELEICYDYSGIECWVTGAWKAKNDLTQKYRDFMRSKADKLKIFFTKVEAHTHVTYNELADELAKRGLEREPGIPEIKRR
ncbi:MAG: reverse transcriptase-like protein, partial [Lachnospiraceae bacterium]|nr:reverse transcriptase-like protein [Lachnospiraceae bacterium]